MKYDNMTREQLVEELSESHRLISKMKSQASTLKKAVEKLRMEEEKYRLHFSLTNDVMFSYDVNLKILSISENIERILGYRPEELVGKYFYDLGILHPADLNDALDDALSALTGRIINYTIQRFFTKNGEVMFGEVSRIPFKHNGKVVELVSVARDVTDRIEREKAIMEGQETAKALLDVNSDTSLLLDVAGNVIAINEPAARRFGKSARELLGSNILNYMRKDVASGIRAALEKVIGSGKPFQFLVEPSDVPVSIRMYPIRDMQGKVSRIAVNARDCD